MQLMNMQQGSTHLKDLLNPPRAIRWGPPPVVAAVHQALALAGILSHRLCGLHRQLVVRQLSYASPVCPGCSCGELQSVAARDR